MQKSTNSDTSLETLNSTRQGTGAVQLRIKNDNSHHDRLSQSKSMILTDVGKVTEPVSQYPYQPSSLTQNFVKTKQTKTEQQHELALFYLFS